MHALRGRSQVRDALYVGEREMGATKFPVINEREIILVFVYSG